MASFRFVKAMCRLAVPPVVVLAMLVPAAGTAGAASLTLTGSYTWPTGTSGQGLATLSAASGSTSIVYRGSWSIPLRLLLQGWQHIGDPAAGGYPKTPRNYLFDAYQGSASATSKMFEVTSPTGQHYDFVHRLVPAAYFPGFGPAEANNNSFAAITPDGQWLVSGEWGTMSRLLVFPAPVLNPAYPPATSGLNFPLVGYINLTSPVQNVQGCDFQSDTMLLCSSDGTKQILQISLAQSVSDSSTDNTGNVAVLAPLPLKSICSGTFETEGIDYYNWQVHVEVIPPSPCSISRPSTSSTTPDSSNTVDAMPGSQAGDHRPRAASISSALTLKCSSDRRPEWCRAWRAESLSQVLLDPHRRAPSRRIRLVHVWRVVLNIRTWVARTSWLSRAGPACSREVVGLARTTVVSDLQPAFWGTVRRLSPRAVWASSSGRRPCDNRRSVLLGRSRASIARYSRSDNRLQSAPVNLVDHAGERVGKAGPLLMRFGIAFLVHRDGGRCRRR